MADLMDRLTELERTCHEMAHTEPLPGLQTAWRERAECAANAADEIESLRFRVIRVLEEVLQRMSDLMQEQPSGRYLDGAECWNTLAVYLQLRLDALRAKGEGGGQ